MKFKEYLEAINKFAEEHPESLDFETIYNNPDLTAYWVCDPPYLCKIRDLGCLEKGIIFMPKKPNAVCVLGG